MTVAQSAARVTAAGVPSADSYIVHTVHIVCQICMLQHVNIELYIHTYSTYRTTHRDSI